MNPNYMQKTLGEMSDMFRAGQISRETAQEYVDQWNASGKHFTVAKVYSWSIGNYEEKE